VNLLGNLIEPATLDFSIAGRHGHDVIYRLDALIMAMKDCKGLACSRPWTVLHPNGGVSSLNEALNRKFDKFYNEQPKMYFDSCEAAYIKEKESNEPVNQWEKSPDKLGPSFRKQFNYGAEWILAV
jgi:N-acetylglucosamine-6-sulfatase